MTANRTKNLLFLCLPIAAMLTVIATAGNYVVRLYPVEQHLDMTVLAAVGAVILGVLVTGWWTLVALPDEGEARLALLGEAQQAMHDYAWLPVAFALFLSTVLFVVAVAALTGTWYMLDRRVRAERDRAEKPLPGLLA